MLKGNLAAQSEVVTMSSLEISALVGSRHDSVKRTIERLAESGAITLPPMVEKPTTGRPTTIYVFEGEKGKRDSIVVVAQLSPEFTAKLVDRWQELEHQITKPTFDPMAALNDPEFLRGTLLTYSEKVISLEHKVEEMTPDVEALERIAKSDGALCITDAAKNLQVQPKFLFRLLSENRWIYKRLGSKTWIGYQDKIQSGYLEHKVHTVVRNDGSEKVTEQALVTAKGLTKLSKMLGISGVAA
ncbi:DNA-binding protein [Yersinia rohdei]|nr:DNA-binding protein [Yersinia rohdei]